MTRIRPHSWFVRAVLGGALGVVGCTSGQIDDGEAPREGMIEPNVAEDGSKPAVGPGPGVNPVGPGAVNPTKPIAKPEMVAPPVGEAPSPGPSTGFGAELSRCEMAKPAVAATVRLHEPDELQATFAAFAAPAVSTWDAPPDFGRVEGLPNDQSLFTVTPAYLASVGDNARALARILSSRAPFEAGCTADVAGACVDQVLLPLGRMLWRRPLDADEKAWLIRSVKALPASASAKERVEAAARMMMLSPQALFRFEGGSRGPTLDGWQRADVISYAVTGAPADAELAKAADTGALNDSKAIRDQIKRMLALPAARTRLTTLLQDMFAISDPGDLKKDAKVFPEFTPAFAKTQKGSFEQFAGEVVAGAGDTFKTLLVAPTFKDVTGRRAGLFTHPAFLMTQADETTSRPIHRARAVVERALCVHLPDPPANAANMKPLDEKGLSPRQRFDKMTKAPQCTACHSMLNPVGFSLDGYDALGKPRTMLGGFPIDTTGTVDIDGKAVSYDAPPALMEALAASTTAKECFVTRVYRHVAGRVDTTEDSCLKARTFAVLKGNGSVRDSFAEAVAQLTESPRRTP